MQFWKSYGASLEGLDQYVKPLTAQRVPGGSHWVVHEKPALVIQYIRDFLNSGA